MLQPEPLPVILSRPHGGLGVPAEIADQLAIDEVALYNDCDLWVDQLFDFCAEKKGALANISMPIARALIDVNRPLRQLGEPDGPVKTHTSYGESVYRSTLQSDQMEELVEGYWRPYHQRVAQALRANAGQTKLFIDCHNMAQHGPDAYRDAGQPRPLICIANLGDAAGQPRPQFGWTMCSAELAQAAVDLASEIFGDLTLLEPHGVEPPVALLNSPFSGSYVAAHHLNPEAAAEFERDTGHAAPPSIMIEVNRGLLVGDQNRSTAPLPPDAERISQIRQRLYRWAAALVDVVHLNTSQKDYAN